MAAGCSFANKMPFCYWVFMTDKPSAITIFNDLQNYYWTKSDLMTFCKKHGLPIQGAKSDLIERIGAYLSAGHRMSYKPVSKQGDKDSVKCITKNTLVKNYNNDEETRRFFVEHIEEKFKFNTYLRQFTNTANIQPNMTYGDLVKGWISFENDRKNSSKNHVIPPQFEFNQFIKDYFKYEKETTLKMAISAWKTLISRKGPRTFERFRKDSKKINR